MKFPTPEYVLGQKVFSPLDKAARGLVTGIVCRPGGLCYLVTWSVGEESGHFLFELSDKPGSNSAGFKNGEDK